ncbi:MAG: sulfite exporter TauE/SafE family protein [Aliiglaciecola sp.]|uniref:sulfite exporter TauE/SafE family protein n=1 Tax=Aliiglaciecola sp. TaxID=1872441 RepID=UPI0032979F78
MHDPIIWFGAITMGLSLGLLGSGGSILTLPLLIFIAKEPEKIAIAESLLIVGLVALVGTITHYFKGNILYKLVIYFGIPSMFSAYAGAYLAQFVSVKLQMLIFAVIMLLASVFMLKPISPVTAQTAPSQSVFWLIPASLLVGCLAGLIGVGGGFLIVPALMFIAKIPIKQAVGTSLVIIVMQSVSGFSQYLQVFQYADITLNWPLITLVSGCAIGGILVGLKVADKLPQKVIKQLFGAGLIGLSAYTFIANF